MKIFVASSYDNPAYRVMVGFLRNLGYVTNDPFSKMFRWAGCADKGQFLLTMADPEHKKHVDLDIDDMSTSDVFLLVPPCRDYLYALMGLYIANPSHKTIIFIPDDFSPSLSYLMANHVVKDVEELISTLHAIQQELDRIMGD